MSDGILLTVGHNQSLYLLVSLHQKSFPMVLQFNMALSGICLHGIQFLLFTCEC